MPEMSPTEPRAQSWSRSKSEPCVQAHSDHRNWSAVAIVCGIGNVLIIKGHPPGGKGQAVIGFQNLLLARIGQLAVADKDSQTSGVKKLLVDSGDAIDRRGNADSVIRSPPLRAGQRDACG